MKIRRLIDFNSAFATVFRNGKYSLESTLFPIFKENKVISVLIDNVALIGLVLGMAASLGAGILTLSGGIESIFDFQDTAFNKTIITVQIVASFVISSITGITKGIKFLSKWNFRLFVLFALLFLFLGASHNWFDNLISTSAGFFYSFFDLALGMISQDPTWTKSWTVFNWSNWMAWAPETAMFQGRISCGLTIRQFLIFDWLLPSLFGLLWMSIFSNARIEAHISGRVDLVSMLESSGPESIIYFLISEMPFATGIAILFFLSVFISYVTAADSNTEAMGGLSVNGISTYEANSPAYIKMVWGILIGSISLTMVLFSGIDGIKILSNLGGLPSLFLISLISLGMIKWLFSGVKNNPSE
jgi:choline-glycine betaine transporter